MTSFASHMASHTPLPQPDEGLLSPRAPERWRLEQIGAGFWRITHRATVAQLAAAVTAV